MSKIHLYLPPEGVEVYKPTGMSIVFQGLIEMDAESSKNFSTIQSNVTEKSMANFPYGTIITQNHFKH